MRSSIKAAFAAAIAFAAVPASAVSIINVTNTGGSQTLNQQVLAAGTDLTSSMTGSLYLFDEGVDSTGLHSFLLHYARATLSQTQIHTGSFDISLGSNETFVTPYASTQATLNASDKAGVTYATGDVFRGLDNGSTIFFGDSVTTGSVNPIHVTYSLSTSAAGLFTVGTDDVRFFVKTAAVPEPAGWAMMIAGFGLLGATLRRNRKVGLSFA